MPIIKSQKIKNLVVASPDKGGMVQATGYARLLRADDVALVYKVRDVAVNDKSETSAMIGDVKNKNVLLVDDVISTGGTIVNAAIFLKQMGAKSVRLAIVHGVFAADAASKIKHPAIDEIYITDTVQQRPEILGIKKVKVASIAPLLAKAINRIQSGGSISRDLIL